MNKVKNKVYLHSFTITTCLTLLLLLLIIICFILFVYFFADPVLCEGISSDNSSYNLSIERLKELKANMECCKTLAGKSIRDYSYWFELQKEACCRPERHEDIEKYLHIKSKECLEDFNNY